MPFSEADLGEFEKIARAASQEPWQWGHTGTKTHEEAIAAVTEVVTTSDDPDLQMVFYGPPDVEGATRVIAYTGNGKASGANARYLQAAQPAHVLALLSMLREAKRDNARLTRRIKRLEARDAS